MGLDTFVCCNCYEAGKIPMPPSRPELVYVDELRALNCRDGGDNEIYFAFQPWINDQACEHQQGILVHHRIGHISLVALLRAELSKQRNLFPLIPQKVVYDGTHGGDYIAVNDVRKMQAEVEHMS
jgi:hypothetical protein